MNYHKVDNQLSFIVDFRINETLQIRVVRKTKLPFSRLVGAVSNCADAVRGKNAPTGERKCLFIFRIHYSADISPILTNRCAIDGCHVAGGPHGVDLRTYDTLSAGGDDGAIVTADEAKESEIVKQIVQGRMPSAPNEPLEAAQIRLIIDWINEGAKNN